MLNTEYFPLLIHLFKINHGINFIKQDDLILSVMATEDNHNISMPNKFIKPRAKLSFTKPSLVWYKARRVGHTVKTELTKMAS